MKKLLITSVSILSIIFSGQAQTPWDTNGNGGTSPSSNFVGTTSNVDLSFRTNNTIKMQLESSGELGIGTTTPAAWLHVNATGTNEAFRTYTANTYDSYWRMFRNGTEYGHFVNFDNATAFYMRAPRGSLKFSVGDAGSPITYSNGLSIYGGSTAGANIGFCGVGDYSTLTIPGRRLDIYDPANAPQLRITQSVSSSIWSEFQTTSSGNLYIDTYTGATTKRRIGIGTSAPTAKLSILNLTEPSSTVLTKGLEINSTQTPANVDENMGLNIISDGGLFVEGINFSLSNGVSLSRGIVGSIIGNSGTYNDGIFITVSGAAFQNRGIGMVVQDADYNYGLDLQAQGGLYTLGFSARGVFGSVSNTGGSMSGYGTSLTNYGIYSVAYDATSENFGIYTIASVGSGAGSTVGIFAAGATWAGDFAGDVNATSYTPSDSSIKENVQPIQNAKSILNQINPKSFTFKTAAYPHLNLQSGQHYGIIAQDLQLILPTLTKQLHRAVKIDSTGNQISPEVNLLTVNYTELIPFLIVALKEQQAQIDSLIASTPIVPRNTQNRISPTQWIELSSNQGILLNQNDPNPFSESTQITYFIPDEVKEAKIMFADNIGTVLRSAKIESRGEGILEVYASELSSGIYTYTLVCDGKVIESKRMMKTE